MAEIIFLFHSVYFYCARSSLLKLLFLAIFLQGCIPYKIPTEAFQEEDHWLYTVIPRHRCQIEWYDVGHWTTWMLLGNDDDGIFGSADYLPEEPASGIKALKWVLRNPLHNFCSYVIGNAHQNNSEFTLLNVTPHEICLFDYSPDEGRNYGGECSSFLVALHGWKPFVSLRIFYNQEYRGDFYIGWRKTGNFGIKCTPLTKSIIK